MKNKMLILFLFMISGCGKNEDQQTHKKTELVRKTLYVKQADKSKKPKNKTPTIYSKYHTVSDTIILKAENNIIRKFSKKDFNTVVDTHSEFFHDIIESPDILYSIYGKGFAGEAGQDIYFLLYAYFLQQRNTGETNSKYRKRLIQIYSDMNTLFRYLSNGGNYFGHQEIRLVAEAEYSVYLNSCDHYSKNACDISKEKKHYIQSLRQKIKDEVNADTGLPNQEKINRINDWADKIDSLITNKFYLSSVQYFQYKYY